MDFPTSSMFSSRQTRNTKQGRINLLLLLKSCFKCIRGFNCTVTCEEFDFSNLFMRDELPEAEEPEEYDDDEEEEGDEEEEYEYNE